MAITAVNHFKVVRNNRSKAERSGNSPQSMEEATSTISLVVDEATRAFEERRAEKL